MNMKTVTRTSAAVVAGALCVMACGGGGSGDGSAGIAGSLASSNVDAAANVDRAAQTPPRAGKSPSEAMALSKAGDTTTADALPAPEFIPGFAPAPDEDPWPWASGQLVVVGSGIAVPAGALQVAQLQDVPWRQLPPGSLVRIAPGTYAGPLAITANGTAQSPIRIVAADRNQRPVILTTMDVQNASHLRISGLYVQPPQYSGFVIRQASHHITVSNNVVMGGHMGINVSQGAGANIYIVSNVVDQAVTHGIGVEVNGAAGAQSVISHNTVRRSGHHGMEIRGSYWRIERNDVSLSGLAVPGTSGIHLFSGSEAEDSGDHNDIVYNISHHNVDTGLHDGNGIEVDRWCDDNTVAFNILLSNDGHGINIYEAQNNRIFGNTTRGNSIDPNGTHGAVAEIIVGASRGNSRTRGNVVINNIAMSTRAGVPAVYVDGKTFTQPNTIGPNLLVNTEGGTVMRWGDDIRVNTPATIDAATRTVGNLVETPLFDNLAAPLIGGMRLASPLQGGGLQLSGVSDFGGAPVQPGYSYFGAYFARR
ncbi:MULTISPECIES: nitrous oxide reductase family maturation protein NosD [unclassified Variovorax]|uniref:right-handed parallel beta-helix repeat-containing protein n=1 Tax=unclassified Variovorax TaxID=663243 RepID=UPI001BD6BCEB|nr:MULTISPECIES: right-handed parallel beta-helix repeat-containing protein [unclassified Variovorax]